MSNPEQINENLADTQEASRTEAGLKIANTPELENVVSQASELTGKIESDQNVTGEDVLNLEEALGKMKIDIDGVIMSIEEIRKIPNFKEQMEINKQIIAGNVRNHPKLTFLINLVAESLGHKEGYLSLEGLTSLSDQAAESLSHHQGVIYLYGLSSLSDPAAESLSRHRGDLFLQPGIKAQIDKFKTKT